MYICTRFSNLKFGILAKLFEMSFISNFEIAFNIAYCWYKPVYDAVDWPFGIFFGKDFSQFSVNLTMDI